MPLVQHLCPKLPACPPGREAWSDAIYDVYQRISSTFIRAASIVHKEADPVQLKIHLERVHGAVLLLVAMETYAPQEQCPTGWLHQCAVAVGQLIADLERICE
jgi:hypothetical protein